jgi:hypothetical protein
MSEMITIPSESDEPKSATQVDAKADTTPSPPPDHGAIETFLNLIISKVVDELNEYFAKECDNRHMAGAVPFPDPMTGEQMIVILVMDRTEDKNLIEQVCRSIAQGNPILPFIGLFRLDFHPEKEISRWLTMSNSLRGDLFERTLGVLKNACKLSQAAPDKS